MLDVERIKEQNDCREVIAADLGKPHYRGVSSWSWRCPFHHEQKGHALVVYADGWQCLGKCQTGGDVITWGQRYHGLSFRAACRYLMRSTCAETDAADKRRPSSDERESSEPPDAAWQKAAHQIVADAQEMLWSRAGERARVYLMKRGLQTETIATARLGYVPGMYTEGKMMSGLWVWAGITIPWYSSGLLWAVNVRRPLPSHVEEDKYKLVKGSRRRGALYWADYIQCGAPVLFVEGEFDCLLAWQTARNMVSPVTLGSAANRLHPRWYGQLISSPQLLVLEDNDAAGSASGERLAALSQRVKRVQVPSGKDLTDYYLSITDDSREALLVDWLVRQIESTISPQVVADGGTVQVPTNPLDSVVAERTELHQPALFGAADGALTRRRHYYSEGY